MDEINNILISSVRQVVPAQTKIITSFKKFRDLKALRARSASLQVQLAHFVKEFKLFTPWPYPVPRL